MESKKKLVRDKIPQILFDLGKNPEYYSATHEEYLFELRRKLVEEVEEFLEDESIEELADVLEVLEALRAYKGYSCEHLAFTQKLKKEKNGGFDKKYILKLPQ